MKKAFALSAGAVLLTAGAAQADVFASNSPAVALPDNTPAGVSDTIVISADETIKDLNVGLYITHSWQGDIAASLQHVESGTTVQLMNRPGSIPNGGTSQFGYDADNYGTSSANPLILDDEAATGIDLYAGPTSGFGTGVAGYAGPASATGSLADFDGESTAGTWILTVSDNAGGDTGILQYWQLDFLSNPVPAPGALALLGLAGIAGLGRRRR